MFPIQPRGRLYPRLAPRREPAVEDIAGVRVVVNVALMPILGELSTHDPRSFSETVRDGEDQPEDQQAENDPADRKTHHKSVSNGASPFPSHIASKQGTPAKAPTLQKPEHWQIPYALTWGSAS